VLQWRAAGVVCAIGRSAFGLHVVLKCPYIEILGRRQSDLHFAPCLCLDDRLALQLERSLRDGDLTALGGRVERCTRQLHPLIAHEWDLNITEANVPPFANYWRRLWRATVSKRDDRQSFDHQ
jgi:hypothetical protein